LDEYFSGVRDIEQRLAWSEKATKELHLAGGTAPAGIRPTTASTFA
jgi:hypothetical protein